jgi:3-isopropylmalate dehydrogenase
MIESTRMLFDWLGRSRDVPQAVKAAALMQRGIEAALADPETRTGDIRGTGRTADMVRGIISNMGAHHG